MDNFWQDLASPSWWIGVVIVGLAINIASAYLKTALENSFSRTNRWWATRTEEKRSLRLAQIEAIRASEKALMLMLARENRYQHKSVLLLLISFANFGLWYLFSATDHQEPTELLAFSVKAFFYVLSVVSGFMGVSNFFAALRLSEVIEASQGGRS